MVEKEAYSVCKLNNKLLVKTLFFVLVLVIGMIGTFSAYAMNSDYLNPSKWENNESISSVSLNKSNKKSVDYYGLDGIFKYFVDENEGCLYAAFFVKENTLSVSRDDVRVIYRISGKEFNSDFAVSKDGVVDCDKEPDFSVYQNYATYNDYKYTGEYISVLDFGKVKYDTQVDISLYINGHRYSNVAKINVPPTKTTTTKAAKTTTQRSAKDKTVISDEKSSKASTERSTKFSPSGTVSNKINQNRSSGSSYSDAKSSNSKNGIQKEGVTTAPNREEQLENAQSEGYSVRGRLTQHSKNIIIVALIIAGIGLCFLIASVFMGDDKAGNDNSSENETPE